MDSAKGEVTLLLERLGAGDPSAEDALLPRVYAELHGLALARLRKERPNHTLQATALVNEAYLRLCRVEEIDWQNRAHFFRVAARMMRRILVDYARQRNAHKRSGGAILSLDQAVLISEDRSIEAIEIDQLLQQLAAISPRQAEVVEMRFFAGLSEQEIAAVLRASVRTVRRDWLMARSWLHQQLHKA